MYGARSRIATAPVCDVFKVSPMLEGENSDTVALDVHFKINVSSKGQQ